METAEFPFVNEVSDDEFDVGALGVMPQVYEYLRLRAEFLG